MKKFLAVLTAAVMTVGMAVSAFAAPSITVTGNVTKTSEAKDANGNALTVTLEAIPTKYEAVVNTLKTTEGLKAVLGTEFTANTAIVDVKEVTAPAGTVFPATLTFEVAGVTANSKGTFLHYNGSAWEKIPATFGAGTMTGVFNSLSPVAFVVDKTTVSGAAASTGSSTTSPKTGESNVLMMTAMVALLAAAGMVVVFKKKKA